MNKKKQLPQWCIAALFFGVFFYYEVILRISTAKTFTLGTLPAGLSKVDANAVPTYGTDFQMKVDNYDSTKISTSVVTSIVLLCLAMIFPLASLLDAAHRAKISLRIEAQLLKTAPKEARITPVEKKKFPWAIPSRLVLLFVAVGLILLGFLTGGTADVLTKAVNICTECVGLG